MERTFSKGFNAFLFFLKNPSKLITRSIISIAEFAD